MRENRRGQRESFYRIVIIRDGLEVGPFVPFRYLHHAAALSERQAGMRCCVRVVVEYEPEAFEVDFFCRSIRCVDIRIDWASGMSNKEEEGHDYRFTCETFHFNISHFDRGKHNWPSSLERYDVRPSSVEKKVNFLDGDRYHSTALYRYRE